MYRLADGDADAVPWQHAASRRVMAGWVNGFDPQSHHRAVVVAAGLGDDAAAVATAARHAGHHLDVTAFDRSPTAVDWASQRHPGLAISWHCADLLALPVSWLGAFDLVIEVFTIQSIDPALHHRAADAVRSLLAPAGTLVAVALVADGGPHTGGPPWPVTTGTLDRLAAGLTPQWHTALGDGPVVCVGRQWQATP